MTRGYLPPAPRAARPNLEHVERPAGVRGGFRYSLSTGLWWWSPGMFQMHGFRPGEYQRVRPSLRLLLAMRHPAERAALAQAWRHLRTDGGLVAFRYRIVGVDGRIRPVFVMASFDSGSPDRDGGRRIGEVTGVMQSDDSTTAG
jgi:PAS domain-containing protein